MSKQHPLSYERGVLDGLEIALRMHARHFDRIKPELRDVRRALVGFRQDANTVLTAVQDHKMQTVAGFFGYSPLWDRISQLRGLVPLPVDVDESAAHGPGDVPL